MDFSKIDMTQALWAKSAALSVLLKVLGLVKLATFLFVHSLYNCSLFERFSSFLNYALPFFQTFHMHRDTDRTFLKLTWRKHCGQTVRLSVFFQKCPWRQCYNKRFPDILFLKKIKKVSYPFAKKMM